MKINNNRLIVVLGMHRSGTSAITRGLKVMGVELGESMMPPLEDNNIKGFWEDIDLNLLNIEILNTIESDWHHLAPIEKSHIEKLRNDGYHLRAIELLHQKTRSVPIFAFKDPRVARLLPFWEDVFTCCDFDVDYVLAVRNPLSVVKSLTKRDGIEAEQGYLLWLGHVIPTLTFSSGIKRLFVDYDRLMQSPDHELHRIAQSLDLTISKMELAQYKDEFLDKDLQHTIFSINDLALDRACPPLVQEIYTILLEIASDKLSFDDLEFQQKIVSWTEEFNRYMSTLMLMDKLSLKISSLSQEVTARSNDISHLHKAVAERDGQIAKILTSTAWKVTSPLRSIEKASIMLKYKYFSIYRLVSSIPGLNHKFLSEVKNNGLKSALRKVKQKIIFFNVRHFEKKPDYTFKKSSKSYEIKVSVIIPTYNRSALLPSLLECWRKVDIVTKYKYEIIFSDDGSDDGSIAILEKEQNLPIKLIKNNHGGAAKARNSAIQLAQGEKLLIIGDDIFPNPEIINQHYEKLHDLPINKAVLGEVVWHKDLEVNTLMKHITELGNEQFSFNSLQHNAYTDFKHFYTCNISIDKEFLLSEEIIFDESFYKVNFEDGELGYRLSKKGMEVFYYPTALAEHHHSYKTVIGFCKRQEDAGEMALVFKKLHPEIESILQVELILAQWNIKIKDVERFEFESILDKVIELCQILEDKNYIEKFNLEKTVSNIYKILFRFYYEKGVVENSCTLKNNVIDKVFTKYFLPFILQSILEIKEHLVIDVIDDILNATSLHSKANLIIEVNELRQKKKIRECYKDFEKDIFIKLKSELKDYDNTNYIYKPQGNFNLHPSNLRQIVLFLQNNPNIDFVLLSFGLLDLPSIGISGNILNNVIFKNNGLILDDMANNKYSGKVIRLISEKYNKKIDVGEIVSKSKINNYGYWNEPNKGKIENQISHFNTSLHKKSGKKLAMVFPIFLAVGGVERNTAEIINELNTEYDFIVVNFERLNESLGSLHHQFLDSCLGVYDLTELSSHDGILNYLKILEYLYKPDLVWICNGSSWLKSNLANIRSIFNNSAIVDQEAYDSKEGWINLYKEKNDALLNFDRFIAINSKIQNVFAQQASIPADKVDLIYSVMSKEKRVEALKLSKKNIYTKYNLDCNQKYIVSIGRISHQKAPLDLVKLIKQVTKKYGDEYKFIIVGSGELSDQLDADIERKGIKDSVIRFNYIDNTYELNLISQAIIFTSLYEGLSIALLEALTVGTPGISTDVGDTKLIFDKYKNGVIFDEIGNISNYIKVFDSFIENYEGYKKNAMLNKHKIIKSFAANTISKQYLICFNSAINHHNKRFQ